MIELRDVTLSYPHRKSSVQAVEGVSFAVGDGEMVALTGPSGSGKSTLLHLAAGLLSPDSGEVLLDGKAPDPGRVSIGLVSQQYGLLAWKKVRENILLPLLLRRVKADPQALSEVTEALGIGSLLDRYPHELSGGQRQRVALARVFMQKPRLLLLDEPFAALDLLTAERSRALFREVWSRNRVTTLIVTHNPREAVELAEKVILMAGTAPGRVVRTFDAPTESALRQALTAL